MLAYVLPFADPLLKVSIIPTGHGARRHPAAARSRSATSTPASTSRTRSRSAWAGACAELIIYGDLSTGASDDLQRNTELARKMVREWGMSDRVGPMAWGSQGMVFLGEDLMHTRDYSEDTSRVVDEEVARILREQEARATRSSHEHRGRPRGCRPGPLGVRDGRRAEIARLVDAAYGRPVHSPAEGEEKVTTERYAPSLSGGLVAPSVSSLPSTGVPKTEV